MRFYARRREDEPREKKNKCAHPRRSPQNRRHRNRRRPCFCRRKECRRLIGVVGRALARVVFASHAAWREVEGGSSPKAARRPRTLSTPP